MSAPSPLLQGGLAFVDTPGVGGHGQPHLSATLGLLPDADAVLMVSDTSQEFTEPEMRFLLQAHEICPVGAVVATKTDLYPHWRQIVDANTAHLERAGLSLPMIPASSLLRAHAVTHGDQELNEESNFPAIVRFLSEKVLSRENDRVRDQVIAEIASATEHLTLAVRSELSAINDPEDVRRLTEDLERRKQEAQDALQHTALWQQVLNDGIADLTADVDHDLRSRFRAITQHTEGVIDSCDPTQHWAEIGAEVENAVATAVGDNFVWAYQRAEALTREVARTFVEAGLEAVKMPELSAREMGARFDGLKSLARLESKPSGLGHKAITSMRGSYGGVLMFGMLTSVAGLGMFNPISLGQVCCWVASPTRRTWRTGCCGCATRPRPTCAGSSTTSPSWSARNPATGSRPSSASCAITTARSPTRRPAHSTSRCRRLSRRRVWRRRSATPGCVNWSVSSTS